MAESIALSTFDRTPVNHPHQNPQRNLLSSFFRLRTRQLISITVLIVTVTCFSIVATYFIATRPAQEFMGTSTTQQIDPCQSFYEYTCQGVYKPRYYSSMLKDMYESNFALARVLIQNLASRNQSIAGAEVRVQAFYTSCKKMNWTEIEVLPFVKMVKQEMSPVVVISNLLVPDDYSGWEWNLKKAMRISKENQTNYEKSLSIFCSSFTMYIFPDVTAKLFIEFDLDFNKSGKNKALGRLIEKVRNSLVSIVERLQWMEEETRLNLTEGIKNLTILSSREWKSEREEAITYLDTFYGNLTLRSGDFMGNWEEIVQHRNSTNRILLDLTSFYSKAVVMPGAYYFKYDWESEFLLIPPGIVQYPTFDMDFPDVLSSAKLGFTLGHEYAHALNVSIQGISNETESDETFQRFGHCLVNQYSGFQVPFPPKFNNTKLFVNGSFTLFENVADVLGIQIAFESLKQNDDIFQPLPGYEGLTKEQIFFVAFAQEQCEYFLDDNTEFDHLKLQLKYDTHSPNSIRVLGALSNFREFARVFDCPVGSPYNPVERCDFFSQR